MSDKFLPTQTLLYVSVRQIFTSLQNCTLATRIFIEMLLSVLVLHNVSPKQHTIHNLFTFFFSQVNILLSSRKWITGKLASKFATTLFIRFIHIHEEQHSTSATCRLRNWTVHKCNQLSWWPILTKHTGIKL